MKPEILVEIGWLSTFRAQSGSREILALDSLQGRTQFTRAIVSYFDNM